MNAINIRYDQNQAYRSNTLFGDHGKNAVGAAKELPQGKTEKRDGKLNDLIRNLNKVSEPKRDSKGRMVFTENSAYKANGFWDYSSALKAAEEDPFEQKKKYNYKDLSGAIQQAKNADSAGKVVIKARRAVIDLKRRVAGAEDDDEREELKIALNHAKRMERVARKKERNLEMEEMVEITHDRESENDEEKSGDADMKDALLDLAEEEIFDAQAKIDKEQTDAYAEMTAGMSEDELSSLYSDMDAALEELEEEMLPEEMSSELTSMLEEFGSEQQRMLEEAMEALESLEVADPHMSPEDLERIKTRHRNSERREIVKADMDYLKDTIEHLQKTGGMRSSGAPAIPMSPVPTHMPSTTLQASIGSVATGIDVVV